MAHALASTQVAIKLSSAGFNHRHRLPISGFTAHPTVVAPAIHTVARAIAHGSSSSSSTAAPVVAVAVRSTETKHGSKSSSSPALRRRGQRRRRRSSHDQDTTNEVTAGLVNGSVDVNALSATSHHHHHGHAAAAAAHHATLSSSSSSIPIDMSLLLEEKTMLPAGAIYSPPRSPLMSSRQSELLPLSSLQMMMRPSTSSSPKMTSSTPSVFALPLLALPGPALAPLSTTPSSSSSSSFSSPSSPLASSSLMASSKPLSPPMRRLQQQTHQLFNRHFSSSWFNGGATAAAASSAANGTDIASSNGTLLSAARSIPHPEKAHKGGEDAHFMTATIVGVADGVGGWAEHGIDPAEYSKGLMKEARAYANLLCQQPGNCSPKEVLSQAYEAIQRKRIIGSTTACLVSVIQRDGGLVLKGANLGDSGFVVIRGERLLYQSKPQTHGFNFPRQLGAESDDKPVHADDTEISVQPGDWVVLGTDGLFDNLYQKEVLKIVTTTAAAAKQGVSPQAIADAIGNRASQVANSRRGEDTPFAMEAQNAGHRWEGGKLDDITVVVAQVQLPPSAAATAATSTSATATATPVVAAATAAVSSESPSGPLAGAPLPPR